MQDKLIYSDMKKTYESRTGHGRTRHRKKNLNPAAQARRKVVLKRLETQLNTDIKITEGKAEPLTEKDKERILKEMKSLKGRLGVL